MCKKTETPDNCRPQPETLFFVDRHPSFLRVAVFSVYVVYTVFHNKQLIGLMSTPDVSFFGISPGGPSRYIWVNNKLSP